MNRSTLVFEAITNSAPVTLPMNFALTVSEFLVQKGSTFTQVGNMSAQVQIEDGGVFNHQGGSLVAPTLNIGFFGTPGSFNQSGGGLSVGSLGPMGVGVKGGGTVIQTGGSVTSRAGVTLGGFSSFANRGFYHISGGTLTACTGTQTSDTGVLLVGAQDGGAATFIQSGGVVVAKDLIISENAVTNASMTVSGGSLLVAGQTINHGALTLSGGSTMFNRIDGSGVMNVAGNASVTLLQIRQQALSIGGNAVYDRPVRRDIQEDAPRSRA
jgi:hypothetical protein